jgi:8-oxo-dGTP pyrophosphatase MutT (NUDIX family)
LLVREKGLRRYSFPGGGIKRGEPAISAAARELYEETGLKADRIEKVMTHEGSTQVHSVFLISAHHGVPRLKSEIDSLVWWSQESSEPVQEHVKLILRKLDVRAD